MPTQTVKEEEEEQKVIELNVVTRICEVNSTVKIFLHLGSVLYGMVLIQNPYCDTK